MRLRRKYHCGRTVCVRLVIALLFLGRGVSAKAQGVNVLALGANGADVANSLSGKMPNVLTTQGDIPVQGASGVQRLVASTAGYCLMSNGAGAVPTWQTCPGGSGGGTTYTASGTGGTSRTISSKLGDGPSVLDYGADPTGSTNSQTAFINAMNANPNSPINVPPGIYVFNTASGVTGMAVPTGFHGTLRGTGPGAVINGSTVGGAGSLITFTNNSGISFENLHFGVSGQTTVPGTYPLARNNASNYGFLINGSSDLHFTNVTIDSATGPGFWINTSHRIFFDGISIHNTSADGLHCIDTDCFVNNLETDTTEDDAFAIELDTSQTAVCGTTLTNFKIKNSAARGIANVGGCDVMISNGTISTTVADGILNIQDSGYGTVAPIDLHINNVSIIGAGTGTPATGGNTGGNKAGMELAAANQYISNVHIINPSKSGMLINSPSVNTVITGVSILNTGDQGVSINGARQTVINGLFINGTANNGMSVGPNSLHTYVHNATVQDCSKTSGLNRAIGISTITGPVVINGFFVVDDQTTATCFVAEEDSNGTYPLRAINVLATITDTATAHQFYVQNQSGSTWYSPDGVPFGSQPTCDVNHRGFRWYTQSAAGTADHFYVCSKNASNAYAYTTIF